jgi:tripartite-type tricarboxylate transporter receptor subunit TctC
MGLAVLVPGTAAAQGEIERFYKGRTVNLVIGAAPGGGHDTYARAIARHMPRHIPGTPTMVPKNMPGAGSGRAADFLFNQAPKDGATFGAIFPGAIMTPLVDPKRRKRMEPAKFNYLGTANKEVRVCLGWATAPVKTFAETFKTEMLLGATADGGSTQDYALVFNDVLKTKFKLIRGYQGSNGIMLAIERGEVHGLCGYAWTSFKSQKSAWLAEKKVNVLVQLAIGTDEELDKMGVPTIWTFVKDADDRAVLQLLLAQQVFGRPYVAPPGVPAAMVKALRAAFAGTMTDKGYAADAVKLNLEVGWGSGEEVQQLVEKVFATPPATVTRLIKAMKGR